jgi:hypothetical protein
MTTPSGISQISGIHAELSSGASVDVSRLRPGTLIQVETKSRTYHMECLGGNSVRISGHPDLCPTPTPAQVQGSVSKEGEMEYGRIERGSRLMFFLNGNRPVNTSVVVSIQVTRPQADQPQASSSIH